MTKTIRLGTSPIAWSNDDMQELGGKTSLATCLSEAALAGYVGIELGHKFPRNAEELGPILRDHAISLISGWYSSSLLTRSASREIEALASHLSLLKAMGCEVVVWAETTGGIHGEKTMALSKRPVIDERDWAPFCHKLNRLADYVAGRGLKLAYHHHMGTVIETEPEIDRLMRDTNARVGLLLDTGHLTYAGGDLVATARRHRERIVHVHCKDVRREILAAAKTNDWSFLDAVVAGVFTVPGDGSIGFQPVMQVLKEADYKGWLVVEAEQDPMKANPLEYAKIGRAALYAYASNAGLDV